MFVINNSFFLLIDILDFGIYFKVFVKHINESFLTNTVNFYTTVEINTKPDNKN